MKKFRIPRKIKKKLSGIYFYPKDEKNCKQLASPKTCQEDYTAHKQNIVGKCFSRTKSEAKEASLQWEIDYHTPIEMSDIELKLAIDDIFAEEFREQAFNIFSRSKNHMVAKKDYYTFVNAYNMTKNGNDKSIICCMSLDSAENDLQKSY